MVEAGKSCVQIIELMVFEQEAADLGSSILKPEIGCK